ncbi:hypothetical protein [Sphingobacterium daejeonense]|uniref:hypothetical protein n=1 Tax=Sphingobacterium daejeonense TaxID=371142 RepID=UPI0010C50ADB|nr:hypothetical protein [Sphingobacterium daejeonense]VTP97668.1 Uncharacterised protein [Sphingobacterium daejeonense]
MENEIKKPTEKEVQTLEESHHGEIPTKNETIKDLNIYQKFVQELINNGMQNFSEIYNLTSKQFVNENTGDEVAKNYF